MKKDDDVKLSTERILFLFCILFYFIFFFCGGNFLDDPFIPHRQPAETSLFHSFLPDCVPLLAQIGFYTVTRINLVLYFIHTTSNNIPVFLFFNVFSLSLCVFSVLISGNLRIDRSSIDHDHRDNSGVVVGFSFVVQLKRIMRTKDTFTQTRIKELLEKAADWHYLFRLIFLCLLSTIFFVWFVLFLFTTVPVSLLFSILLLWLCWGYLILIHREFLDRLIIHARSQNTFYRRRLSLAVESSPTAGRFNLLHCCCPAEELAWMANNQIYLTIHIA